jgi:hypothetical protein
VVLWLPLNKLLVKSKYWCGLTPRKYGIGKIKIMFGAWLPLNTPFVKSKSWNGVCVCNCSKLIFSDVLFLTTPVCWLLCVRERVPIYEHHCVVMTSKLTKCNHSHCWKVLILIAFVINICSYYSLFCSYLYLFVICNIITIMWRRFMSLLKIQIAKKSFFTLVGVELGAVTDLLWDTELDCYKVGNIQLLFQ